MKLIKPTILFTILFSLFFTNISHAEVSEKNYLVSKTDAEKKYELGVVSGNGKYSTLRIFTPTSFNDIQHGIFA